MDAIQRRKQLAEAFSAHDPARVKSFLHSTFVIRGADGVVVMDAPALLARLPAFFYSHPEYRQSVEIESSKVTGDTATLVACRREMLHVLTWSHEISSRWIETWKKQGDDWILAEEKPGR